MAPIPEPIPVDHRDAGVGRAQVELPGEQRGEAGADLSGRTLSTARTARSDGQGRRHDLDDHGSKADASRVVMHRRDGGIGAVAFGLRGEPNTRSAPSSAPRPTISGSAHGRENDADAGGRLRRRGRHVIAGQYAEEEVGAARSVS